VDQRPDRALAALGFDPDAVLLKEPGILLDSHFMGALHVELREALGAEEAELALLQMGFLHGLQDGLRAVKEAFGENASECLIGPPLAIRLRAESDPAEPGAIAFQGLWPQRTEACARATAVGQPDQPSCFLSAGYTSGWLSGTLDADILALEQSCGACGAESCSFAAREASAWRICGDPAVGRLLDALPFEAFRSYVGSNRDSAAAYEPEPEPEPDDPRAAVVHIWGPVMIIPFAEGEEALEAVELIGKDPAASDVSVVVVDLSGANATGQEGSASLERVVEMIEAWGAEAVFAAVSPAWRPVVSVLERQPVAIHPDLPHAIAAAFQIASAQRSLS
jgi:hypothetical protein